MEIITGYTGENHVTSADDASLYRGILGQSDYVLDVGNKFAATIIDNNTIRIADGDLIIQGHQARIRANDYEEVTIDNGTPGQKRNDLIVARYQKNTTTGIESITLEVVKGTPGETATDPDIIQEDLSTGGTQRDFALYRVTLNGLVLESVTSLFTVLPNLEAFKTHLAESAQKHITESGSNDDGYYIKFDDGTMIVNCTRILIPSSEIPPGARIVREVISPQPFSERFYVEHGMCVNTGNDVIAINYSAQLFGGYSKIVVRHANINTNTAAVSLNPVIIGRWK